MPINLQLYLDTKFIAPVLKIFPDNIPSLIIASGIKEPF